MAECCNTFCPTCCHAAFRMNGPLHSKVRPEVSMACQAGAPVGVDALLEQQRDDSDAVVERGPTAAGSSPARPECSAAPGPPRRPLRPPHSSRTRMPSAPAPRGCWLPPGCSWTARQAAAGPRAGAEPRAAPACAPGRAAGAAPSLLAVSGPRKGMANLMSRSGLTMYVWKCNSAVSAWTGCRLGSCLLLTEAWIHFRQ